MSLHHNTNFLLSSQGYFPNRKYTLFLGDSPEEQFANTGASLWQNGELVEAVRLYSDAISQFADIPYFYACRSLINTALGDEEGAFYDYQVAKSLDKNYHNFLEWCENDDQMVESDELQELNLLIKKKYSDQQLYINRAMLLVQHFKYADAIVDYTKSLQIGPAIAAIYVARAAVYTCVLRYDLALEDLNHAIAIDERSLSAHVVRARLYISIDEDQLALVDFDQALAIDPTESIIYEDRALHYDKLGNLPAALEDYSRLIALVPDDFYLYSMRADVLERNNQLVASLQDYDKAIALNPCYSDLYQYRAAIKERLGDTAGAKLDYVKFEELELE